MSHRPRLILLLASAVPFVIAAFGSVQPKAESWNLIVSGAIHGTLAPCGCTKPMSGGIRRRATLIRTIYRPGDVVVELGPIVDEPGRQSEIKVETLAQSLRIMKTQFIALQSRDLLMGDGVMDSLSRLSDAQLLKDAEIKSGDGLKLTSDIGAQSLEEAIEQAKKLVTTRVDEDVLIFVTHLERDEAHKLVAEVPHLDVLIYSSHSNPEKQAIRVGKTWLISPADEGKFVVGLKYTGGRFEAPVTYTLGPEISDDPTVARYYGQYLDRLRMEKLVEAMPKSSSDVYAGTEKCRSCHEPAYSVWKNSKHSQAWATLKADKHDADPDCVGCHTVGIQSSGGFIIEEKTPHLTNVGCESCHGSGSEHIKAPEKVKMPTVGQDSCSPCHKLEHSPNFRFSEYWHKIKH